jgi:hypothetical protein
MDEVLFDGLSRNEPVFCSGEMTQVARIASSHSEGNCDSDW